MKTLTLKSLLISLLLVTSSYSFAADIDMNANANDLAIKGYDPVAYFTLGKAAIGTAKFTATYKGAIYQFKSADHRDMFRKNPGKYAPQYGGYCAFGVSMEKKFDTDPLAWKIVNNKLYLNLNKAVQKRWAQDTQAYIEKSERSWFTIKNKTVKELSETE